MANEQNLRPGEYKFTLDEHKKGGIASGKARREQRDRRLRMQKVLDMLVNDETTLQKLKKAGVDVENGITFEDAADAMQALKAARDGDTNSYKAIKDECYGPQDKKTAVELTGDVSGITVNVKKYDGDGK